MSAESATHAPDPPAAGLDPGATVQELLTLDPTRWGPSWSPQRLGVGATWPPELLLLARMVQRSQLPSSVCMGTELVQIYNGALARVLGDKHPNAWGQPMRTCWAEAWPQLGPLVEEVVSGGGAFTVDEQLLFLQRHGYLEETYWTMSLTAILGSSFERLGLLFTAIDVTDRVVARRRMRTLHDLALLPVSEQRTLPEASATALEVLGRDRHALPLAACYLWNGPRLTLAGAYGAQIDGRLLPAVLDRDAKSPVARAFHAGQREVRLDGRRVLAEVHRSPIGPGKPHIARLVPIIQGAHRDPIGLLVLGLNPYRALDGAYAEFTEVVGRQFNTLITDVSRLLEERSRVEDLDAAQQAATEFYANVSHELRTPLTVVAGSLDMIAGQGGTRTGGGGVVEAAQRATARLEHLVEGMLVLGRAEGGALVPRREPTDLARLTRDVASMFQSVLDGAGLQYAVDVPDRHVLVDIDREMWSQILLNLVSNAFKFTPAGRIAVTLEYGSADAVLTVQDTGGGIPADSLEAVFERFRQAGTTPARGVPGAGIGLALVADLARALGGSVSLESTEGVGSRFRVVVPVEGMPDAPGPSTVADARGTTANSGRAPAGTRSERSTEPDRARDPAGAAARHALVVEDSADLRAYLVTTLQDRGWWVTAVEQAEDAVGLSVAPDVVITDVVLPGADGLTMVRMLRAHPEFASTPIVVVSGRAAPGDITAGLDAGADDYLVKPFRTEELLARLEAHIDLARLRMGAAAESRRQVEHLRRALASNRAIGTAIGVLMASERITSEQAFARLRRKSNASNVKLAAVAERVALTGSLPD
ncbi:MAG: ATP-binding protein [Dermatophilaceae bacterium]